MKSARWQPLLGTGLLSMALWLALGAAPAMADCIQEHAQRSYESRVPTTIEFMNHGPDALMIYWLDFQGKRVHYQTLLPGQSYVQSTYVTHPWVLVDGQAQRCIGIVYPDASPRLVRVEEGKLLNLPNED